MKDEKISIIIPTFNRAHLINETIICAINQTYRNLEIIVVDDGSTDNTKEIINEINDERIHYIYQNHSGLPAKTRNRGIIEANGSYLAFLDSDDLWTPKKLEIQMNHIKKQNFLLIASNFSYFPREFNRYPSFKLHNNKIISFQDLLGKNYINSSSVLFRKDLIKKIGFMDESKYLRSGQDYDFWLKVLKYRDKSILLLKEKLVKTRIHDSNLTISKTRENSYYYKELKKYAYLYKKYRNYKPKLLEKFIRTFIYNHKKRKFRKELDNQEKKLINLLKTSDLKVLDKIQIMMGYYSERFIPFKKRIRMFIKYLKI
jgi:glycosyltransferase involved in cell wall biosynthesis